MAASRSGRSHRVPERRPANHDGPVRQPVLPRSRTGDNVRLRRRARRRRYAVGLAALVLVGIVAARLAFSGPGRVPVARPTPPPLPSTQNNIHLGIAFDYNVSDPRTLAARVDYIFGGYFVDWNVGPAPPVRHIDAYLPFDTDPYPQYIRGHSLSAWKAIHPDWIVYRCDRKTPAYYGPGSTNIPLDFTNPAVRAWQVKQIGELFAQGAQGVGFDDFTFANFDDRCGVYRNGVWTPLGYPGSWQRNNKYTADMISWLRAISAWIRLHYPTKIITVSINVNASGLAAFEQAVPYVDMVFDEGGFTSFGGNNLSGSAWQQEVDALEFLNANGRAFDVNALVNARSDATVTPAEINWVLANYLLVKGAHSYTYIYAAKAPGSSNGAAGYGEFYDRPQYHVPIGRPTSHRFQSYGVQLRYYSGGLAIVNPSPTATYTVLLGATYRDPFGHTYTTSVTLPPTTGIVLLDD